MKIEGKGVCRKTDQMKMNHGNTLCLGGVQNPTVHVDEEPADTYDLRLDVYYPDGHGLADAPFELVDASGASLGSGTLDDSGLATVTDLDAGRVQLKVKESAGGFLVAEVRKDNARYQPSFSDPDLFQHASHGQQLFWGSNRIARPREL